MQYKNNVVPVLILSSLVDNAFLLHVGEVDPASGVVVTIQQLLFQFLALVYMHGVQY